MPARANQRNLGNAYSFIYFKYAFVSVYLLTENLVTTTMTIFCLSMSFSS